MIGDWKRELVERFLRAYNAFDIEGMLALLHPEVTFQNVAGDRVNAEAFGIEAFRKLAEQSSALFVSREQTLKRFQAEGEGALAEVAFVGVLAADLPNGMRKGEVMEVTGRSEYRFREGRISGITDISP